MKITLKKFSLLVLLLVSLVIVSCGSDGDGPATVEPRTAADVREDFSNLVIADGVNDLELESLVNDVFWNFRIIRPIGAGNTNKKPLILRLHGGASNVSSDAHKSTGCLVEPGLESLDAFILSPNSNGSFWYDQLNIVQVLALVDLIKQYLPVDVNRIVVMGYSDGGNGSFFYAQFYPQLFSAAIPIATSYDSRNGTNAYHNFMIPIYAIHGDDDQHFPIAITEDYINGSIDVGSDIQFNTAIGLGHLDVCDYVPYLQDAATWLQTEVWD